MNSRLLKLLFALTLLLLSSGQAFATATTHIWGPSTDFQAFKVWHIHGDLYFPVEKDSSGNRLSTLTCLGITVGVLPFKNLNAEVGFDHKSGLGAADDYPMYYNFKLGVPEGVFNSISPAMAIGVLDIGTKKDVTNYNVVYGKMAKTIALGGKSYGRISAGYFTGNKNLLLNSDGMKDNNGIMLAWERTFSEISDNLWFCVEYMGTESVYGTMNIGGAWKFAPNVALLAGYDIYNNDNLPATGTLQFDIDF
jgi:hypothetical protein